MTFCLISTVVEMRLIYYEVNRNHLERAQTVKGRKDLIDFVSLVRLENFNWERYQGLIRKYGLKKYSAFARAVLAQTQAVEELELNVHAIAKLKRKILRLL